MKLINRGNTPGPCKLSCAGVGVLSEMCSAGIIFKTACTNTFAGQGQLTLSAVPTKREQILCEKRNSSEQQRSLPWL